MRVTKYIYATIYDFLSNLERKHVKSVQQCRTPVLGTKNARLSEIRLIKIYFWALQTGNCCNAVTNPLSFMNIYLIICKKKKKCSIFLQKVLKFMFYLFHKRESRINQIYQKQGFMNTKDNIKYFFPDYVFRVC